MRSYKLFRVAGFEISTDLSAVISSIVLWLVIFILALVVFQRSLGKAIIAATVALALHWLAALIHQLGHILAARSTGYPMSGFQGWLLLGRSMYPDNEPELPGHTHIRRALGGPIASLIGGVVGLIIVLALADRAFTTTWWLATFFFLDNLLVFALGSMIPLGFNDASTIIGWRNKSTH